MRAGVLLIKFLAEPCQTHIITDYENFRLRCPLFHDVTLKNVQNVLTNVTDYRLIALVVLIIMFYCECCKRFKIFIFLYMTFCDAVTGMKPMEFFQTGLFWQ